MKRGKHYDENRREGEDWKQTTVSLSCKIRNLMSSRPSPQLAANATHDT